MNKNLKSRLLYLPLNVLSRVELWLVYKDQKPAATITLRDKQTALSKTTRWMNDANLIFLIDKKDNRLIHVSKDTNKAEFLQKNKWSENSEHIFQTGLIYGYPKKAAKQFSINPYKMMGSRHPYARYKLRKDQPEDLDVANKWQQTIREDIPKLAKWFENAIKLAYNSSN